MCSDGAGVVIGSTEHYDLMRIKLMELQARLHFIGVTPKIFGIGFKILQHTGMRSIRCQHTEASNQGKNGIGLWPTWCKFSKGFSVSSAWGLYGMGCKQSFDSCYDSVT